MKGMVESMKVKTEFGSKGIAEPFAAVEVIESKSTIKSRDIPGARLKVTLFGTNLERS